MYVFGLVINLRIRGKLLLAFSSILVLSCLLAFLSFRTINKVDAYKSLIEKSETLTIYTQALEIAITEFSYEEFKTKEFLTDGKSNSLESFRNNYAKAIELLKDIKSIPWLTDQKPQSQLATIQVQLNQINLIFSALTKKLKERGFKDLGLEGSLRKAIHKVEKANFKYDKAELLTLRKQEKDFLLRKDVKYQVDFNKSISDFLAKAVKTADMETLELIARYRDDFNKLVETETEIGLTESSGMRGNLRNGIMAVRPMINDFNFYVTEQSNRLSNQALTFLAIIVFAQISIGIFLAVVYSTKLSRPVKEINSAVQSLASGSYPEKMKVDTNDEMGQTKSGFNQFIERLQTATRFAETLGKGNLQIQYDENFKEDVLAGALITMQLKLREAEEQKSKINWANEGGAKFNDILKREDIGLDALGDEILRFLIHYIQANQGALYIRNGADADLLERISSYAYGKKKFVDQQIHIGNGLVGQCALEGQTIYLKEVPPGYVSITSGLGQATPRVVLILPLEISGVVMGVLEIASFQSIQSFQIDFLEKISENIATLLSNRKNSELTKELLKESQERAEMLTQQEEEMRQNTEEMQATQEEMVRQKTELELEIAILRSRLGKEMIVNN